ncbi:unnamed protein product, partial [Vitis vinifera]
MSSRCSNCIEIAQTFPSSSSRSRNECCHSPHPETENIEKKLPQIFPLLHHTAEMNAAIPLTQRLSGKVALITGGASGIGASTAKLFVKHGAKVIVTDVQDQLGRSVCKEIGPEETVFYDHCDVTCDSDVQNAVDTAISKYGKLDIMFSNAGISGEVDSEILLSDNTNFKRVFDVNAYGAFLAAKHAARVMIPAKTGCIIFTSSVASVVSGEISHAYVASKHAVVGLANNLCVELGQYGLKS